MVELGQEMNLRSLFDRVMWGLQCVLTESDIANVGNVVLDSYATEIEEQILLTTGCLDADVDELSDEYVQSIVKFRAMLESDEPVCEPIASHSKWNGFWGNFGAMYRDRETGEGLER
jgi:hypothetical protein